MPDFSTSSRTDANLHVALAGEADANRRYIAYGVQALNENRPDIAQLFFEAAGAETVHALSHLKTMGAIGSTRENLIRAATGESEEIDVILPRMVREAEQEGRHDAAASFRLALDRERHHRDMFRRALVTLDGDGRAAPDRGLSAVRDLPQVPPPAPAVQASMAPSPVPASPAEAHGVGTRHSRELESEPERIARLSSIREVVFGAQDGLVSTFAVVAGLAAAGAHHLIVFLAGAVSVTAGLLSMSVGTFLSSRAQRQFYEAELAHEHREIQQHRGEEMAELMAAFTGRGVSRTDAAEIARRLGRHPNLLLELLGVFELGLAPQRLGTPVRDALVMAVAFALGGAIPVLPFLHGNLMVGLYGAATLTIVALFVVGALKARLARVSVLRSGLEVIALGVASGVVGFGLGRLVSVALGVNIG